MFYYKKNVAEKELIMGTLYSLIYVYQLTIIKQQTHRN